MQRHAMWDYIFIGQIMRLLQDALPGAPLHEQNMVLDMFRPLERALVQAPLPVSARAFRLHALDKLLEELEATAPGATLTDEQQQRLRAAVTGLWTTVAAEAAGLYLYSVTQKRMNAAILVDRPGELFAPGAFDALPPPAQRDFTQAARCIGFELPTSAVFHLMRGIGTALRELSRPERLDAIRADFRDPTQDPEAEYDIDEAQDLLSRCVDAVNRAVEARPG